MRADPANAHAVLSAGGHVLVYPGGELDAFRTFRERNRVIFGPRKGFVRVAARAKVPIVPVVAHGAHSSGVILDDGAWISRLLKLQERHRVARMPIALALPWGVGVGPLPYLPLPFPIQLRILPPVVVSEEDDGEKVRDEVVARMQTALDEMARRAR
jgi:1-acyl-sn-glycerol-3-phosphate acyltransferase